MDITIYPSKLNGRLDIIPSKSYAHRMLICAAFSDGETELVCSQTNQDIEATVRCLNALGADIHRTDTGYTVIPVSAIPAQAEMNCGESGSTLRFILPVIGALGVDATIYMEGRLSARPILPLWEVMEKKGCSLSRPTPDSIRCTGKMCSGDFCIPGNISSQYITGLLFAMALLPGESQLTVTGETESLPYINITQDVMSRFNIDTSNYRVKGCFPFRSPKTIAVEGDWSNGAFFHVANAIGNCVEICGLNPKSIQGDRKVVCVLDQMDHLCTVDARHIPDLIPILSVAAAGRHGAEFQNIQRLRLKESDRVAAVCNMLNSLGINACATQTSLFVEPCTFHCGIVDSAGDHRIAMAAAIAATISTGAVTILGAECVAKSYPSFWDEYKKLGGNYEQYIRK